MQIGLGGCCIDNRSALQLRNSEFRKTPVLQGIANIFAQPFPERAIIFIILFKKQISLFQKDLYLSSTMPQSQKKPRKDSVEQKLSQEL